MVAFVAFAIALVVPTSPVLAANPSPCREQNCGLASKTGPYGNLIVGTLVSIDSDDDLRAVVHWAKHHGLWRNLPADPEIIVSDVKMVSIALPKQDAAAPVTVFLDRTEFESSNYKVGDFVRYSPHRPEFETPPADADGRVLQQGLTGCVATLCRSDDPACLTHYKPGVYSFKTGQQIRLRTGALVAKGTVIDTMTMFIKN